MSSLAVEKLLFSCSLAKAKIKAPENETKNILTVNDSRCRGINVGEIMHVFGKHYQENYMKVSDMIKTFSISLNRIKYKKCKRHSNILREKS